MIKEFFCEIFFTCAVATADPLTVDELMHRAVLFDAYQSEYPAAFVKALAMEESGWVTSDNTDFALTKASLAVQQGLNGYAQEIFAGLEARPLTRGDRLRLALEKARLYHQRGDLESLRVELATIDSLGAGTSAHRHPELLYLQADLLVQERRFQQAGRLIEQLAHDEPFRAYALFNMAMALRDAGRPVDAWDVLRLLLAMPGDREEVRDLRDRGRLAMARLAGELDRADDAAPILEDLPADSRYRPAALMAYGQNALRQGDHALAVRVFGSVVREQPWFTSTSYAQVALPMALQGMTEPALVVDQFRFAQERLERRARVLGEVQNRLLDRAFVSGLLKTLVDTEDAKAAADTTRPWRGELPDREWLDWLAAEELAPHISAWRDHAVLARWTQGVPQRLAELARTNPDTSIDPGIPARAESLHRQLLVAMQAEEDQIAARLGERLEREAGRVEDYLLTADVALAKATDQVAGYSRAVRVDRPRTDDPADPEAAVAGTQADDAANQWRSKP